MRRYKETSGNNKSRKEGRKEGRERMDAAKTMTTTPT